MLEKRIDSLFAIPVEENRISNHCVGECDFLRKEASAESISYFNNMEAKKGYLYFLVVAMTAGEYYGSNKNGDYFKEDTLIHNYTDFKKAGVFWNHDNKDASKSSGRVVEAFWNDKMHRIELIIEIKKENARHLPEDIKAGRPIGVSMGLKVPDEHCSICGHVTKNSYANRCEHLKYSMNVVLHDGKKIFAICGGAIKLFDISFVFRPADRNGYAMLTKEAGAKRGGLASLGM